MMDEFTTVMIYERAREQWPTVDENRTRLVLYPSPPSTLEEFQADLLGIPRPEPDLTGVDYATESFDIIDCGGINMAYDIKRDQLYVDRRTIPPTPLPPLGIRYD